MTVHLVTFATDDMDRAQDLCEDSALRHGVHGGYHFHEKSFGGTDFYRANWQLLNPSVRGFGYWSWKPYIIDRSMGRLADGDILIYSDAGVEFINNVSHIIERMDQDIFLFGNNWEHAHWCKRDVIDAVWPLSKDFLHCILHSPEGMCPKCGPDVVNSAVWGRFGKQVQASVIFFRVSDYTRAFVAEWLKWCLFEGGRLIDDSPSRLPNHPEFREHRHDQAILTTMAYREGINLHYWPAMYNDGAFSYEKLPEYAGDDYPILFHHHRRRNHEWESAA